MRPRFPVLFAAVFAVLSVTPALAAAGTQSCESLATLKISDATVTSAMLVPAGQFSPPGAPDAENAPRPIDVPSFCRVQLTAPPAIKIEVWLPVENWNGNFNGVGGGGFAGTISYPALADSLKDGYATASTDTGHEGNNANFAFGDPLTNSGVKTSIEDFGYLGIHAMTTTAKQIIDAFYGTKAKYSYFTGCSQGGRQALTEAQRYPEDYNGILAGAPGINYVNLEIAHMSVALATLKDEASYIPPSKLAAIQEASIAACDTSDGLKDGLIANPRVCKFDPSVLLCKGANSDSCLTAKQVEALKKLYAGTMMPDGGVIYPGHFPGAEKGWNNFTTGSGPYKSTHYRYGVTFMRNFVFQNKDWDFRTWDFSKDVPLIDNDKWLHSVLDSYDPNLKSFRDHGGKLIMYQGWADDDVSPVNTINYYKNVVATVTGVGKGSNAFTPERADFDHAAEQTGGFLRLFMLPGMNHCRGGTGPNTFDGIAALSAWVAKNQAPRQILASHSTGDKVDRTRPLCPYPQTAEYSGQGSIDDAANFACKLPKAAAGEDRGN